VKKASVSETKNHLSAILREVREGETYLIVDHGKPVARIEPLSKRTEDADMRRADLERRGILRRGRGPVRKEILQTRPPRLPKKISAVAFLLAEREDGR
jgi:prevent-host-death family protein